MKKGNEEHDRFFVRLKAFCELKKNGNRALSLRHIEEQHPKRAENILSYMQEAMYGRGAMFSGTTVEDGIGWYLRPEVYAMNTAKFIEFYKSTHT